VGLHLIYHVCVPRFQSIYVTCWCMFNPLTKGSFKRVAQWTLEKAKGRVKTSQTVCQSLEKFCSLLSELPQCFVKLHDKWRSWFLCVTRMDPLHKPWFIFCHIATAQFFEWVMLSQTHLTFVYCLPCSSLGLKYQQWCMKRTKIVAQRGCQWCTVLI
jgi:hypothetical protein